ncbi:MAG: KilA-N domain-containing protein [Hymenobacter sp.]|nr:MAG: KilA-N domain-containing protein [Hymenobacter sp.]
MKLSAKEGQDLSQAVANWLRINNTIEFLALWEKLYGAKEDFSDDGYQQIILESLDQNGFSLSAQKWVQTTGAIGIEVKRGRTGGIYAHQDIALEFCTWRSPIFKLYVIKEFERLKEAEQKALDPEWTIRRVLSKVNYRIQTDAVRDHLLPTLNISQDKERFEYAEEADVLNLAVFGMTAKDWRETNPTLALQGKNLRDVAGIDELTVISNLEGINAMLLKDGYPRAGRLQYLSEVAAQQLEALRKVDIMKSMAATQKAQRLSLNASDTAPKALKKGATPKKNKKPE